MSQIVSPKRSSPFYIKLLGTPTLEWKGQIVSVSRKQARALIFVLGTTLQPISRDHLGFLFWSDKPEFTAKRNLSRLLSYIRKTLPHPEIIQVNKEGIGFNTELVRSDAAHFMDLVEQNELASQETMVKLYGGLFLSGFVLSHNHEFDLWLGIHQRQFEHLYLSVLKNLIQLKFAKQDYATAIEYAQQYLAIDEIAEDIHQLLIQIHVANGDRIAAMRQFETCTLILERELGVGPLPETRAVYEKIRSGERDFLSARQVKPAWTVLPSLDLPLIGRQEAWDELEDAYYNYKDGGMILISGEPGVGKSRMVQEYATSKDCWVLSGNCHANTQALAYQPLVQVLRQALSSLHLWDDIRPVWLTETSRLLPELGEHISGLPKLIEVEPDQAQARLYEGLSQTFLGLARNTRLLLCLDDLQWVDEATSGWLAYISNRLAGSGICILGTYRVEGKVSLGALRETYRRPNLLAEISLSGLTKEAIKYMLVELPNQSPQPDSLAQQIRSATGGNPFFVLETIRNLLENNILAAPPSELPLPNTVQSAIKRRFERLSPISRQILEAAAVLYPDLNFKPLQETAGRSDLETADGLDELVKHQLLVEGDPYRFNHDLTQQVAYLRLSPWRRQLLHHRAAQALSESYPYKQDQLAPQIARHYDKAGEVDKAVQYYYQAALASRCVYAHEKSIDYLQRALKLSSATTLKWHEIAQYYELLGESLVIIGKFEDARQAYSYCLDQIPDEAYLQRVKCQTKLAGVLDSLYLPDQAEGAFNGALMMLNAHSDDQEELAWQQAWLDIHLARLGLFYQIARPDKMRALLEEIQPVIEKAGTPEQRSQFYEQQGGYRLRQDRYAVSEQTILSLEANLRANLEIGNPIRIAGAKFRLGFVLLWSGNLDAAVIPLTEALEIAEETGRLTLQLLCLVYLTCLCRLQGDVEGTRTYATRSLESSQELNSAVYIGASYGNLAWLDWKAHKFDQAERRATEALSVWEDYHYPFKWLANWVSMAVYLDRDQLGKAIEAANLLLDPKQHRQPDVITMALEKGMKYWEIEDIEKSREFLEHAVNLAKKWGYL